jgi:hypothetical protein
MAMLLTRCILFLLLSLCSWAEDHPTITMEQRLELQKRYVKFLTDKIAADRAVLQVVSSQKALADEVARLREVCANASKELSESKDGDVECVAKTSAVEKKRP